MSGGPESGVPEYFTFIWFGLIFAVMYLLLIRPQKKKQKEHEALLNELKKGDKIITNGGMFGVIFAIDDERNRVVVRIGNDTKMEFLKTSISARVES